MGVEALDDDFTAIKKDFDDIIARLNKNHDAVSKIDLKPLIESYLNQILAKLTQDTYKKYADQIAEFYGIIRASELYGLKYSSRISENSSIALTSGQYGNKPYVPLGSKQSTYMDDRLMNPLLWQKGLTGNFNASVTGNISKITAEVSGTLDYGFKFSKEIPSTIKIGFKCTNGISQYGLWSYDQKGSALALPKFHVTLKQGDVSFTADYKDDKDYGLKINFSRSFGTRK